MMQAPDSLHSEIAKLKRKLDRETRARIEAEQVLEARSAELYDTNQRLQAEALRAMSLTTAVESASDGLALADAEGWFTYMNAAHAEMFGYAIEDLIGKPWSVLYGEAELERFASSVMPEFAVQGVWRGEATAKSRDGAHVMQEVVLTALPGGGLICATRDITARRVAQIQARAMEQRLYKAEQEAALFTLGNAVAHDFNNLIAAITGYAMLIKRDLDPESVAYTRATRIEQAAEQAAGVIRTLERERSNDTQTLSEIDLVGLVRTGLAIAEAIRPPQVRLVSELPETAVVTVNEVSLSRGLLNVVKNAFEAMAGEGELSVRVARVPSMPFRDQTGYMQLGTPAEHYDWIIEIRDSGPGIRQEQLARIFDPFFTTKSRTRGSGLGLLSLIGLTESGRVFVEVTSHLGHGTQFRLSFKAAGNVAGELPEPAAKATPVARTPAAMTGGRKRILVVEDEVMVGEVLLSTLLDFGYEVALRHDPKAALRHLKDLSNTFDLLLTDLNMPGLSGEQLAREARAVRADLPIIIYSAQAGLLRPDPIYSAILRKPIAPEALRGAIEAALQGKGAID